MSYKLLGEANAALLWTMLLTTLGKPDLVATKSQT